MVFSGELATFRGFTGRLTATRDLWRPLSGGGGLYLVEEYRLPSRPNVLGHSFCRTSLSEDELGLGGRGGRGGGEAAAGGGLYQT